MPIEIPPYRATFIEPLQSPRELRALVGRLIPHLKWRHHGLGMLQAYLSEGGSVETRVHIWHPDLYLFPEEEGGRIHDHRFGLMSSVLVGSIGHDEVHERPVIVGYWKMHEVIHARVQRPDDMPTPLDGSYEAEFVKGTIHAGHVYTFPKRVFHRSRVTGLAVTLVSKLDQDDTPARLLIPDGHRPGHGIGHNSSVDFGYYTSMAVAALLGEES